MKRTHLHDLYAKLLRQLVKINLVAVLLDEIHHIYYDYHRKSDFNELRSKIKVSLDVCAIDNIQDGIRLIIYKIIS